MNIVEVVKMFNSLGEETFPNTEASNLDENVKHSVKEIISSLMFQLMNNESLDEDITLQDYFTSENDAEKFADKLREEGFDVRVQKSRLPVKDPYSLVVSGW